MKKIIKIIYKIIGVIVIFIIGSIIYGITVELIGHGLISFLIMFVMVIFILFFLGILKKSKKLKTMEELQKILNIKGYASWEKIKTARDKKLTDPNVKQKTKEEIERLYKLVMR